MLPCVIAASPFTKADCQRPAFDICIGLVTRNVGIIHISLTGLWCMCTVELCSVYMLTPWAAEGHRSQACRGLMRQRNKAWELTFAIWSHLCLCLTYDKAVYLECNPKGLITFVVVEAGSAVGWSSHETVFFFENDLKHNANVTRPSPSKWGKGHDPAHRPMSCLNLCITELVTLLVLVCATTDETQNPLLPVNNSQQEYCITNDGDVLLAGDSWKANACTSCTCNNGTIQCFSQRCPAANCRVPVLRKGQCCPHCLGEYVSVKTCLPLDKALSILMHQKNSQL